MLMKKGHTFECKMRSKLIEQQLPDGRGANAHAHFAFDRRHRPRISLTHYISKQTQFGINIQSATERCDRVAHRDTDVTDPTIADTNIGESRRVIARQTYFY